MRTRELPGEVANCDAVAGGEGFTAINNFLLEGRNDGLRQVRAVHEVPQILQEMRVPENRIAACTILLENLEVGSPVPTDEEGWIGEEFPTRLWDRVPL